MNKSDQLDALSQEITSNGVCADLASQATQLVLGAGNPDADIVFIGEAPGKKEDEQGEPFVGAAGKFLNEMLDSIGLDRSDVYITNIVKYRPPDNRDPLPEEKKTFLPYLQRQLEIIQPQIVVTLGRHSMNCFLPDLQISKVHGEPKRITLRFGSSKMKDGNWQANASNSQQPNSIFQVVILPLYHPAAALYNGGMRQTLLDDFAAIPTILKKIKY